MFVWVVRANGAAHHAIAIAVKTCTSLRSLSCSCNLSSSWAAVTSAAQHMTQGRWRIHSHGFLSRCSARTSAAYWLVPCREDIQCRVPGSQSSESPQLIRTSRIIFREKSPKSGRHALPTSSGIATQLKSGGFRILAS